MPQTERRRFDFLRFTNEYKFKSFENSQILNSKKIKLVYLQNTLSIVSYNHEIVCNMAVKTTTYILYE